MTPAQPGGSATRTFAWLYCPPGEQPLLAALCALEAEIGASLKPGIDHEVAHRRLGWWREECERCARGAAAHPLTRALTECFAGRDGTPLAGLAGLADAAAWDLASATFERRAELKAYCERWAEAMIVPLASHAAPQLDRAPARRLGAALREEELLRSLPLDARAGRLRLPLDELGTAGVEPDRLAEPAPWPPALAALLRSRHAAVRAELAAGVAAIARESQPALRALLVWAALAHAASRRTEARLPAGPPRVDPRGFADGWRAWRAARRANAGGFTL